MRKGRYPSPVQGQDRRGGDGAEFAGIGQHHAAFLRQLHGPVQLAAVQGDGLLAQHMLALGEGLLQIGHVGVVGGGDVDRLDLCFVLDFVVVLL